MNIKKIINTGVVAIIIVAILWAIKHFLLNDLHPSVTNFLGLIPAWWKVLSGFAWLLPLHYALKYYNDSDNKKNIKEEMITSMFLGLILGMGISISLALQFNLSTLLITIALLLVFVEIGVGLVFDPCFILYFFSFMLLGAGLTVSFLHGPGFAMLLSVVASLLHLCIVKIFTIFKGCVEAKATGAG